MKKTFTFLLFSAIVLSGQSSFGQQKELKPWQKAHYLSEEEMKIPLNFQRNFEETDPPIANVRNVAEYETAQGVIVRYPFGIPMQLIKEMSKVVPVTTLVLNEQEKQEVLNSYQSAGIDTDEFQFVLTATDSKWTRDYSPWFIFDGNRNPGIVNFAYNRPARPNDDRVPIKVGAHLNIPVYGMKLFQTGGNYMSDGWGIAAQTDLVHDENPQLTIEEIKTKVKDYLGIDKHIALPDPQGDYIKHIDCWGKFLDVDKILIAKVDESNPQYDLYEETADYFSNTNSSYGWPYKVYRVYAPGENNITPYTNSLILNDHVFVPVAGEPYDEEAIQVYKDAMPGYTIHPIYYNGWLNTDALHCRTHEIPDLGMLYIKHIPKEGCQLSESNTFRFETEVIAYNGQNIYSDSVIMHYQINKNEWEKIHMTHQNGDMYFCDLNVTPYDDVKYYIYAADESGRHQYTPFVGKDDPNIFHLIPYNEESIGYFPSHTYFDEDPSSHQVVIHNYGEEISHINFIEEEGFFWQITNMPTLPLELNPGEEYTLNVSTKSIPVSMTSYINDSINIKTQDNTHLKIPLGMDETLVNIDEITKSTSNPIKVLQNPSHDCINFQIELNKAEIAQIKIYNVQGKLIGQWKDLSLSKGTHHLSFDASKSCDGVLPSGSYFIHYKSGKLEVSEKVILIH